MIALALPFYTVRLFLLVLKVEAILKVPLNNTLNAFDSISIENRKYILKPVKDKWSEKPNIVIDLGILDAAFKYLHKLFKDFFVNVCNLRLYITELQQILSERKLDFKETQHIPFLMRTMRQLYMLFVMRTIE